MRGSGTSVARLRLLDVLHCYGPLRMRDVGDRLGVTARNVTALVDGLEADGLVRRVAHATDRRVTMIELTRAGATQGRELWNGHVARAGEVFEALPPEDRQELLRLIGDLRAELDRRSGN